MLTVPASKVSVPFTVVRRTVVNVSDNVLDPPKDDTEAETVGCCAVSPFKIQVFPSILHKNELPVKDATAGFVCVSK